MSSFSDEQVPFDPQNPGNQNAANQPPSNQPPEQPSSAQPFAFCQNCGKPLAPNTARVVGQAVFCEPCLAARIAGAPAGYTPVNPGSPGAPPPPNTPWSAASSGEPNPGLAALLGLMPGVGAMYNEQYAKGIVHLFIFAILVSFTHISGIFGLFVFGWICYMAIEAHHTAKARRDGTPLPNPFGFNDIGERFGLNNSFTSGPSVVEVARDAARAAAQGFNSSTASATPPTPGSAPGPTPWGAPADQYSTPPSAYAPPPTEPPAYNYAPNYTQPYGPSYAQNVTSNAYQQVPTDPYAPVPPMTPLSVPQSRFPAGAVWLIALGTIFLLGTTGIFHAIRAQAVVGFAMIALGLWVFLRRMTEFGNTLTDDGSPDYRFRVLRALRPAVWLVLVGILFLLDTFRLVRWEYTWPWFIILAGLMMILNRALLNSAAPSYVPYPVGAPIPQPAHPAPTGTAITPAAHDLNRPEGGL